MILKITINIKDLFNNTLKSAPELFNYTSNKQGLNLGLKYRYEFINFWLEKKMDLSLDEIKNTNYFKLISKPLNSYPRDGGKTWIYKDPITQANRFLELAHSLYYQGYIKLDYSNELQYFEEKTHEHIEVDANLKVTKVNYKNRKFAGLIEVMKYKNRYIVLNGHHRIAILKSFLDNKIIHDEKVLVKFERIFLFERIYLKLLSIFLKLKKNLQRF